MPPAKTVQIKLGGEDRTLCYRFAAFRALGLTGPLDGEGWDRVVEEAGQSFDGLAKFVHAGLIHEGKDDTVESVLAGLSDWDTSGFIDLIKESSLAVFGPLIDSAKAQQNGNSSRPPEAQAGQQPGPSALTTSGSPSTSGV